MKRFIGRTIFIIFVFFLFFMVMEVNKYQENEKFWFNISEFSKLIVAFVLIILNSFCYKLINNKYIYLFYINIFLIGLYFVINTVEINLLMLFLLVLNSAIIVNILCKENKLSGYLSLPNLVFSTYLLVSNQIFVLIA